MLAGVKLYDDLNRATSVQVPDETGTLQTTTMAYSGLSVVTTNPKSQHKTEVHDALGQLIQTVDAIGGTTQFTFDSFGNLVQTNDPMSNQVNIAYDLLGRKTTLSDPDLGTITYGIDPRGLQWQQVSPNERLSGQTSTFQYDVLDRLVLRSEPDLSSYWVFDQAGGASTCTATASCGKLVEAYTMNGSLKQYDRLLGYDSVGRPVSTVTTVDALYTMTTTYDIWGRLSGGTAQRGSGPLKTFGRRYNGNGYLAQVLRGAGSGAQVLWQANQQDASDRVINATLGNGLVVSRDYNAYTGRLADAGRPPAAARCCTRGISTMCWAMSASAHSIGTIVPPALSRISRMTT